MSGIFDDAGTPPRRGATAQQRPAPSGRSRALLGTAAVLVVGFFLLSAFTDVWTDRLWFDNLGYAQVFNKVLGTRVLLFVLFGGLMGGFVALNVVIAFRRRPAFGPGPGDPSIERYRDALDPLRRWVVVATAALLALIGGGSASGQWRSFLLWRHGQSFGTDDPYFKKDIGFFVFDLPWWHYVVNFALMTVVLGLVAALLVHYLFGGIRLQSRGDKLSSEAQAQLSVLLGLFVLVKAVDYYLDRYDLTTDQGRRFTGMNYTAFHAVLPSKTILTYIAVICALLFFANVLRRTWLLPTVGLGLLVLSAVLLGALWPGIVWQFQVRPSEPDKEQEFLARNIEATRSAYDVENVDEQPYNAALSVDEEAVQANTESLRGVRLIDPARTSQAFEQLQQVRGYYSVAPVLDVDRYEINGTTRDVVLGVRELDQSGLVDDQRGWANEHTVYTHGFGVIAAYGNNRDAEGDAPPSADAPPPWAEEDLPPKGQLSELTETGYEPRIYFGEKSPTYSIVGKPDDGGDVELDIPEEEAADGQRGNNTYDGDDGVPVGGVFNKALYALKFGEPNILLSNRVNENSKILYERHPRERVEKVAPWLTVDQDPYPAVVDGKVVWILDGYTMTDRYPNAERESLEEMTTDALAPVTSYVTLPTDQINYMRNSVKAVVDAYDGSVTLYQWEEDPIVDAWSEAFPEVVQPRTAISDSLMEHLRYPEDMFKVQRHILATYHVTEPQDFFKGTDFWKVPEDPADPANKQPPYRLSVQLPPAEPVAETISPAEGSEDAEEAAAEAAAEEDADTAAAAVPQGSPKFSLTSVYVPTGKSNMASFISVDSEPTAEGYGRIRILRLPDTTQVPGPSQIANTFAADDAIQTQLLPIQQNSRVLYGNLLTLPVGGGLLYVQPVYALREVGEGSYPVLRFVLASFGENAGYGRTLNEALDDVLGTGAFTEPGIDPGAGGPGGPGDDPATGTPAEVLDLLRQADAKYAAAQEALVAQDLVEYARLSQEAQQLVEQALAAAEAADASAGGTPDDGAGDGSGDDTE